MQPGGTMNSNKILMYSERFVCHLSENYVQTLKIFSLLAPEQVSQAWTHFIGSEARTNGDHQEIACLDRRVLHDTFTFNVQI
jgi:hypothetical protein